jgi:hypothetical protein
MTKASRQKYKIVFTILVEMGKGFEAGYSHSWKALVHPTSLENLKYWIQK